MQICRLIAVQDKVSSNKNTVKNEKYPAKVPVKDSLPLFSLQKWNRNVRKKVLRGRGLHLQTIPSDEEVIAAKDHETGKERPCASHDETLIDKVSSADEHLIKCNNNGIIKESSDVEINILDQGVVAVPTKDPNANNITKQPADLEDANDEEITDLQAEPNKTNGNDYKGMSLLHEHGDGNDRSKGKSTKSNHAPCNTPDIIPYRSQSLQTASAYTEAPKTLRSGKTVKLRPQKPVSVDPKAKPTHNENLLEPPQKLQVCEQILGLQRGLVTNFPESVFGKGHHFHRTSHVEHDKGRAREYDKIDEKSSAFKGPERMVEVSDEKEAASTWSNMSHAIEHILDSDTDFADQNHEKAQTMGSRKEQKVLSTQRILSEEIDTEVKTLSSVQCEYHKYGCDFKQMPWNHINECKFRPVPCPDLKCTEYIPEVKLLKHIGQKHPFSLWLGKLGEGYIAKQFWNINSKLNFKENMSNTWVLTIWDYDGQSFIAVLTRKKMHWYSWVYVVGHMLIAKQYEYTITMSNAKKKTTSMFQGQVHPIEDLSDTVIKSHNCFVASDQTVKKFLTKEGVTDKKITEGYDYRLPIEYCVTRDFNEC